MRRAFVFVVIAGCARAPSVDATPSTHHPLAPATASVPAVAAASVSVSASAGVALMPVESDEPEVVHPLPPVPAGADPDRALYTTSICAAATMIDVRTKKVEVGCRSHPPFARPEQKPDGKLVPHKGDPLTFCAIDRIYRGSFSRPRAKQALLSFAQCKESDDADWDMGFPGSAVLVEEIGGRWKAVGYEPAVNANACLQAHRGDGRDVLLCRSGLGAFTAGSVTYFFLLDFARTTGRRAGTFAKIFSNDFDCSIVANYYNWTEGVAAVKVSDFALADLNKDGTPDLVVQLMRAHAPPSPTLEAKVRASCKQLPNAAAQPVLPPLKKVRLEFLSDGNIFVPSPASKAELDAWEGLAPQNFNGLAGVAPDALTR